MKFQSKNNNINEIYIKNELYIVNLDNNIKKDKNRKLKFKFNEKYKINILILFIIGIFLLLFISKKNNHKLRNLDYSTKIELTIYGTGTKQILYKNFESLPSKIIINEEEIVSIERSHYFNQDTNIIELIWNYQLTNCSNMFSSCKEISKIDLSNFDSSKVVNMSQMFYQCNNLESINLNNFDTSSATNISKMFFGCIKLTSINVSNFKTSKVVNMAGLFGYLEKIEYFNLDNFDTSSVTSMQWMFMGCSKLISIDLSKFNTSSLINIGLFFHNCISLKSFNLSNFDTSKVECIASMFFGCINLENINLLNFNTSSVTDIRWMFQGCSKLKYLDISSFNLSKVKIADEMFSGCENLEIINFNTKDKMNEVTNLNSMFNNCKNLQSLELSFMDTSKVTNMKYMFNNCESLKILNIPNFKIISVDNITSIFNGCRSLQILNAYSFISNTNLNLSDIFIDILDNLIFCINDNTQIISINYLINQKNATNNCLNICNYGKQKLIKENGICINNCSEDINNKYEFNNICYNKCPNGTKSSFINEYFCIEILNFTECETKDLLRKECEVKEKNINTTQNIINQIRHDIESGEIELLLKNVTNKEKQDIILSESKVVYQISSIDNQKNKKYDNNISTINIGECENKLKDYYKVYDSPFIIFKTDIYEDGLLMPIVEYEIYHPYTLKKIDLNICIEDKIQISVPVKVNESNLEKHNPSSIYYNDICYPSSSLNGADLILADKIYEYVNYNYTLCENNCKFSSYNTEKKQVVCECQIKTDINVNSDIVIDKKKLLNDFTDIKSLLNLDIMKCYNALFTKKGLLKNIGNYILLSTILFYIISIFIFIIKGYNSLIFQVKDLIHTKMGNLNSTTSKIVMKSKNVKSENKKNKKNENKLNRIEANVKKKKNKKIEKNNFPPLKKNKSLRSNNSSKKSIFKINSIKSKTDKIKYLFKYGSFINKEKNSKNEYDSSFKILKINKINRKSNISNSLFNQPQIFNAKTNRDNKKIELMHFTDYEINSLPYKKALEYDKRTYIQYYFSLLRTKHLLIFSFFPNKDYNSRIIKICLFFFSFVLYYSVNALFFNDSTMHEIYQNSGGFNFIYHLPQIIYSTFICLIVNLIVKTLSLTEKNILEIKNMKISKMYYYKVEKVLRCIKIKLTCFFIFSFIFLIAFWYYLSSFCAVFPNTQIHLLKDTIISFLLSLLYQFGINLIPGLFRMNSLNSPNKDKFILYKISMIIQLI